MTLPKQNNFDHIRLFLAIGVFLFHTAELTQLPAFDLFKTYINVTVAVHSFFIVSGFLIFMSYERSTSLKSYLSKRLRRIAPAYITVVVTLFLLLSLFSDLSVAEYFSSVESWSYLLANLTTLNFLHPVLPGVFENNYLPAVNGSLWTIKVELMFYLSVPIIAYFYRWFGATRVLLTLFVLSALYYFAMGALATHYQSRLFFILQHQLPAQLMFFSGGALLYYNYERFKKHQHLLFVLALLLFFTTNIFSFYPLYAITLSIIVVYLATSLRYLGHIAKYGDLSYGIYIWHFPLIQIFIALGLFNSQPWLAFSALALAILTLAWLSWHLIEKPFLSRKSHYIQEEQGRLPTD